MSERICIYRPEMLPEGKVALAVLNELEKVVVSGEGTNTVVYQLGFGVGEYYLKVVKQERQSKLISRFLSARRWVSSVELEAEILVDLQRRGFETIPVVAAGTEYRWGIPVSGFMLSKSLPLPSLECILRGKEGNCLSLWKSYGELTARLHDAGYWEPLRAKDILYESVGERQILLDRGKPKSILVFNKKLKSKRAINRAAQRNIRSGLNVSGEAMRAFFQGYDGFLR